MNIGAWELEMPGKPSILYIFNPMAGATMALGTISAIATGFDQVTREKESRLLKILLAHPIYRDEIITSKALGGFAALPLAMSATILIALALLLLFAIVPSPTELGAILAFQLVLLVYLFTFFSVALLASEVVAESGSALVWSLVAIFVFSSIVPMTDHSHLAVDRRDSCVIGDLLRSGIYPFHAGGSAVRRTSSPALSVITKESEHAVISGPAPFFTAAYGLRGYPRLTHTYIPLLTPKHGYLWP